MNPYAPRTWTERLGLWLARRIIDEMRSDLETLAEAERCAPVQRRAERDYPNIQSFVPEKSAGVRPGVRLEPSGDYVVPSHAYAPDADAIEGDGS